MSQSALTPRTRNRLECHECVQARAAKDLGPLALPVPTGRERVAALVSAPDDPWWEVRIQRQAPPGERPLRRPACCVWGAVVG